MRRLRLGVFPLVLLVAWAVPASAAEPLRWGTIRIDSAVPPDSIGWNGALGLEGRPVAEAPLDPAVEDLLQRYARAGYPFATVRAEGFDLVDGRVAGTLRIDPGRPAHIEALVLDGAKVTRRSTAERLAGVRAGQPYTGAEERRIAERLRKAGLFTSVGEVRALGGTTEGGIVLRTEVREPPYTRFAGILGVSGRESRVTGLVDLDIRNLAGTAREAAARWESRGEGLTRFALRYREPWLPLLPVGVSGHLRHDVNEGTYSYTNWEIMGELQLSAAWRARLGLGGARAVETTGEAPDAREGFVVAELEWDQRNSVLVPTAGFRISLASRRGDKELLDASGAAVERVDRTRWDLAGEAYRGLGGRWLAVAQSRFQYLDTPEETLPRYDLFAVGGTLSLRGYREEQFLAAAAWTTQTECRLLQDDRGSAVYAFLDAGLLSTGTARDRRDAFDRFLYGYGVGVRQAAAGGVLGVEYGIAGGEGPLDGRIHLRLETSF